MFHRFWWLFNETLTRLIAIQSWCIRLVIHSFYDKLWHSWLGKWPFTLTDTTWDSWHKSNGIRKKYLTTFFRNKVPWGKPKGILWHIFQQVWFYYFFYFFLILLFINSICTLKSISQVSICDLLHGTNGCTWANPYRRTISLLLEHK